MVNNKLKQIKKENKNKENKWMMIRRNKKMNKLVYVCKNKENKWKMSKRIIYNYFLIYTRTYNINKRIK